MLSAVMRRAIASIALQDDTPAQLATVQNRTAFCVVPADLQRQRGFHLRANASDARLGSIRASTGLRRALRVRPVDIRRPRRELWSPATRALPAVLKARWDLLVASAALAASTLECWARRPA